MLWNIFNKLTFDLIAAHRASANTLEMIAILKKVKKVTASDDLMLDTFCYGGRDLSPTLDSHRNLSKMLRYKCKRRSLSMDDDSMTVNLKNTDAPTNETR